jgi:hypothetical protein
MIGQSRLVEIAHSYVKTIREQHADRVTYRLLPYWSIPDASDIRTFTTCSNLTLQSIIPRTSRYTDPQGRTEVPRPLKLIVCKLRDVSRGVPCEQSLEGYHNVVRLWTWVPANSGHMTLMSTYGRASTIGSAWSCRCMR